MSLEKPAVTELHVRMDCNGCMQKIRRAVHGVEGVYDTCIDFPQQKLTVVGIASPEQIVRAIKKIRKVATVSSHTEAAAAAPDPPPAAGAPSEPPAADVADPPPPEAPPAEAAAPTEEPAKEAPAPEEKPADAVQEAKDVGEIPMVHHYPYGHGHGDHWSGDHWSNNHGMRQEGPYYVVTHSYSNYRPSASVSEQYGYMPTPPETIRYHEDYYPGRGGGSTSSDGNNNITSMFSDENPNACRIV